MRVTYLDIHEGDTILSIAKRAGLSVPSIIRRHNWLALPNNKIVDFSIPSHLTSLQLTDILPPLTQEEEELFYIENITAKDFPFETVAKYRCEQLVMTKLDGVVRNHAETKREFLVKKILLNHGLYVRVSLSDNAITVYPNAMSEAVNLLSEIDMVKCDFVCKVDPNTGHIEDIITHQELISRWNKLKEDLALRYDFLRTPEIRQKVEDFIKIVDSQITDMPSLLQDLKTKVFFDLFFDRYLVVNEPGTDSYSRNFYSQLFDGLPVDLDFKQECLSESPDTITIKKEGKVQEKTLNKEQIAALYDAKYKPMIRYKFSDYNYEYQESCIINTTRDCLLDYADVLIREEVRNNIELITDYKLRRIE